MSNSYQRAKQRVKDLEEINKTLNYDITVYLDRISLLNRLLEIAEKDITERNQAIKSDAKTKKVLISFIWVLFMAVIGLILTS